jgi:hypothetical protein
MTTTSKSVLQKEKLMAQLKDIESKLQNLDKQRAEKIAKLAKKHKITDLDDSIIEREFIELRKKYDNDSSSKDQIIKKSEEESVA